MAKDYWMAFGSGNPADNTGLTPTMTIFQTSGGTAIAAPAITEPGSGTGLYKFSYGPTASIIFVCDGGAGLDSGDRYIIGALDPIQAVDEKVGSSSDSFGSTSVDPTTIFGYVKRNLEFNEGDASFNKSTGVWDISSRGSSTLLREKTLTNNTTAATKT